VSSKRFRAVIVPIVAAVVAYAAIRLCARRTGLREASSSEIRAQESVWNQAAPESYWLLIHSRSPMGDKEGAWVEILYRSKIERYTMFRSSGRVTEQDHSESFVSHYLPGAILRQAREIAEDIEESGDRHRRLLVRFDPEFGFIREMRYSEGFGKLWKRWDDTMTVLVSDFQHDVESKVPKDVNE